MSKKKQLINILTEALKQAHYLDSQIKDLGIRLEHGFTNKKAA